MNRLRPQYSLHICSWHLHYVLFAGRVDGILLGDSGYSLKRYLVTPFLAPHNDAQNRYNTSLCRTRVLIEQTFGIIKRRFSCIQSGLRTNPHRACKIIVTCFVLHNIGIDRRDIIDSDTDDNLADMPPSFDRANHLPNTQEGKAMRNYIVGEFFQN